MYLSTAFLPDLHSANCCTSTNLKIDLLSLNLNFETFTKNKNSYCSNKMNFLNKTYGPCLLFSLSKVVSHIMVFHHFVIWPIWVSSLYKRTMAISEKKSRVRLTRKPISGLKTVLSGKKSESAYNERTSIVFCLDLILSLTFILFSTLLAKN